MIYNQYAGVDSAYRFPPEVRQALANSTELKSQIASEIDASLPRLNDSTVKTLIDDMSSQTRDSLDHTLNRSNKYGLVQYDSIPLGRVQLDYIYGNGGDRVQLRANPNLKDGGAAPMPYFEVAAAREGSGTDVGGAIGGYQAHWVGDGTTPSTERRSYWFVELKELGYYMEGHTEIAGFVGIGTSARGGERFRDMSLHVGGRLGTIFHAVKPYLEITRNTALVFDDRARPGTSVGSLHQAMINIRREGQSIVKLESVGDAVTTRPVLQLARATGTVANTLKPRLEDILGEINFGTADSADAEKPWIYSQMISARIITRMREAWTDSARGSSMDFEVSAIGQNYSTMALRLAQPTQENDTSMMITFQRDEGVITTRQVRVGARDSGGAGYRMLRVPN